MPDGSLRDRIEENRITLSTAQDILLDICRGVRHAHRHGIVHADLKPENVLFRDDTAKVGDWGLAKVLLEHSTSIEGMTPNYAAPEQLDPDQYGSVDDQTDVYQIGVMAYEMLTGTVPFEGSTPAGTITSILSDEPIPPSEHSSRLPTAVDDIILKAMAKEKKDRYESVLYLRDDVQELLTER
jgi:serine/threonine protein kinase